jgi:3-carboxy-cis,cis-muconate cycloisomerase
MAQEHERAAGAWQSEWGTLIELLALTGGAAASLSELLGGLEVDVARMRANLDTIGDLVMTESVATALGERFGRSAAQQIVQEAATRSVSEGRALREELLERPEVAGALGPAGLDRALDPERYLGVSGELIDRALAAHRRVGSPAGRTPAEGSRTDGSPGEGPPGEGSPAPTPPSPTEG